MVFILANEKVSYVEEVAGPQGSAEPSYVGTLGPRLIDANIAR